MLIAAFQLIGHKKPSVPIFATGLSLLEPTRGGGVGLGLQPSGKGSANNSAAQPETQGTSHTQVGIMNDNHCVYATFYKSLQNHYILTTFIIVCYSETCETIRARALCPIIKHSLVPYYRSQCKLHPELRTLLK
jgi:hypothetical protein